MKKTARMIGCAMLLYMAGSLAAQIIMTMVAMIIAIVQVMITGGDIMSSMDIVTNGWFLMSVTVVAADIVGPLCAWLFVRKMPSAAIDKRKLSISGVLMSACVCFGTLYAFGYLSEGILWVVAKIFGTTTEQLNAVNQMSVQFSNLQYILLVCVLAPIVEELLFRGLIIKKMLVHGRFAALVLSAAIFGLVHGTISQIPYALALGLVLGYVYIRFGNIYLNMGLHAVMNFIGGVLYLFVEDVPYIDYIYTGVVIALILGAIVIVVLKRRDIKNFVCEGSPEEVALPQQTKAVLINAGFIGFAALCLMMMVYSLVSMLLVANL